jgi:16S rRNA (cytidine1402-2'-O)-methyltransferase
MPFGTLYLIPTPLGAYGEAGGGALPAEILPAPALSIVCRLRRFVAENAKSARAFLKAAGGPIPLPEIAIAELPRRADDAALVALLAPLLAGDDMGLVSDAGCPAVADPGAALVAAAHAKGIAVRPLIGPSALLLALMAGGLEGQRFAFHGYLPVKDEARKAAIEALERESARHRQTQLFIETPYRNAALFAALLRVGRPDTRLSLGIDLASNSERIATKTLREWQKAPPPDLDRHPTVFSLLAAPSEQPPKAARPRRKK